ncbi:MAG: DUF4019 domain-containing protein [Burkholderiales bacterium]
MAHWIRRLLVCVVACLPALSGAQSQAGWTPSDQQKLNVTLATQQYFSFVERGDFASAYAMLSKDMQRAISLERWSIQRADFNARVGEVLERHISNITWGLAPAVTPQGGVLAAVNHQAKFRNADIHCGKLFWQQQNDGSFKLMRELENSIDRKTQSQMTAEQLTAARQKIGC